MSAYNSRIVFVGAFFLVSFILLWMTGHIWKMEFIGNSYLSDAVLVDYLTQKGYGYGSKISDLDLDSLDLSLRNDFDDIIWASAYVEGTKLVIELQECMNLKQDKDMPQDYSEGVYNIVADCDGTVLSIITRTGTPQIKAHEDFVKGQILVSGREIVYDDNREPIDCLTIPADADIWAMVSYDYEEKIPCVYSDWIQTGKHICYWEVQILDHEFSAFRFFNKYKNYADVSTEKQISLFDNLYLPIATFKHMVYEEQERIRELSYLQAKSLAEDNFENFVMNLQENGVSILDKNVIIVKDEDSYVVTGKVYGNQKVGYYEHE